MQLRMRYCILNVLVLSRQDLPAERVAARRTSFHCVGFPLREGVPPIEQQAGGSSE